MIKEITVPDGYDEWTYFTKKEETAIAIECFASKTPIEYVLDDDGKPTEVALHSPAERARITLTRQFDKQINKYRKRKGADAVQLITNIVS